MKRSILLAILLLSSPALAQDGEKADPFVHALAEFERARATAFRPGGKARLYPAAEALAGTGDVRAVERLVTLLRDAIAEERRVESLISETQQRGASYMEKMETLGATLRQLKLLEQAGRTDVGPKILAREEEKARLERSFQEIEDAVTDLERRLAQTQEIQRVVERLTVDVLGGLEGEAVERAVRALRGALDVADREASIFLVRILDESDLQAAAEPLSQILEHPEAHGGARLLAIGAIARREHARTAALLVELWERDPEGLGPHVRAALSRAARRDLETPDAARRWVEELGEAEGGADGSGPAEEADDDDR